MPLSPDDSRPPFRQVADDLRRGVRSGEWGPGDQLPSTNDLAERYRVARGTVRAALRVLSDEGLVVARQGSGVFVRTDPPPPPTSPDDGTLELVVRRLGEMARDVQRLGERVTELELQARRRSASR